MAGQNILTESFRNADVSQFNWLPGISQAGALPPILTARSSSSASPGGIAGGGADAPGSGALRLTNNTQGQGSFVIYNKPLNAASGLSVEFDLYAYGGSSADGISFFLIDGTQSPTAGGAVGRSLGYSSDSSTGAVGIVGGYLGVGFDEFGNFSTSEAGAAGIGNRPQSITVRGREGLNYPLLQSVALPAGSRIDVPTATSREGNARRAKIDLTTAGLLSVALDVNGNAVFDSGETFISNLNVTQNLSSGDSPLPTTFKFGFAASTGGSTNFHEINNLSISTFSGTYTPLVEFPTTTGVISSRSSTITASIDVATDKAVTIPLLVGGTAQNNIDYRLSSQTITIAPGQTTGSITLTRLNSPTAADKTIQINLDTPTNADRSPRNAAVNLVLAPGVTFTNPTDCEIPDFDGNGGVDLPWRNVATTESAIWLINGTQVSATGLTTTAGPNWEIVSTRDFNADGRTDLLWRNGVTGENAIWLMNGTAIGQAVFITPQADLNWEIVGSRDFNNDGQADIFWQNSATGQTGIWLIENAVVTSRAFLTTTDTSWEVADFADFNGDGSADIAWRNAATGENGIWLINGTTLTSAQFLPVTTDLNWEIIAVRDTSGDGKSDFVWRNRATGENAVWLMDGITVTSRQLLTTVSDLNWQIVDVCDTSGDAKADLIWRNTATGENAVWLLNGATTSNQGLLTQLPDLNWEIIGARDTSRDGKADVIWRNRSTGQNAIWLLDGITITNAQFVQTVEDPNWQIQIRPGALAL
ncbi:FG-GAP-like repeat-containing protein [Leptolyngbya sp. FACHB-17]|uniref:FG-GAP-like repeat-containing protein n=1 Tax=unclassified Leptolyngbya TaxID=2650499 RepID=UPI001680756E|nr:FG-GAP-like repeat-containing protein [Leptolyngbya sp. FACHB-17]MBD2079753.1 VCBS repeat-containing protein [Leptolyngbya sp. FACHB-17]